MHPVSAGSDLKIDDDVFDYKEQHKVEKFTSEDLYNILGDEAINTKNTIEQQNREAQIVYQTTDANTESLKRIWKMKLQKLDTEIESKMPNKDLTDFEKLETEIFQEISRRKAIGTKKFSEISLIEKETEKSITETKSHQEEVMALMQEAGKLVKAKPNPNDSYLRRHFVNLVEKLTEIVKIRRLKIEEFHAAERYLLINPSTSEPFSARELFSDSNTLIRPDLIKVCEKTGLFKPKDTLKFSRNGKILNFVEIDKDLVISSSTGFCYPMAGNVLLDPGRLKLLVFDDYLTSTSDKTYFIPFISSYHQQCPAVRNPAQFRLWNEVVDPDSGIKVPIMGATLVEGELLPVGKSLVSPVTGLKVWLDILFFRNFFFILNPGAAGWEQMVPNPIKLAITLL